ncbi:YiiX/YebB-like N1pC/P60 family cysteine hydrolase [Hoeflea alexandrii]
MRNTDTLPTVRRITLALLLILGSLLQGCTGIGTTDKGVKPARASLQACCTSMEDYPRWYVDMARTVAPALGTVLSHVSWRSGYLRSKQAAQEAVMDVLQPLDIVLVSSKGKRSGQMIPGLFGHAAIYLGTEQELRHLGIWSAPEVEPHHPKIRAGHVFIEADAEGVHLSRPSIVLNTDAVAVLRPRIANIERRRRTAVDFFAAMGMKFDFLFDVDSPDCTFCTELIHRTMPQLDLPIMEIYGVRTIMPDSVAVAAIRRRGGTLAFVGYVKADRSEWKQGSIGELANDIGSHWADRQR